MAPDPSSLTATLVIRHSPASARLGEQLLAGHFTSLSRDQALAQSSADPQDIAAVENFVHQHGLRLLSADPVTRSVKVAGTPQDFERTFGIKFDATGAHRMVVGTVQLPEPLRDIVVAVLGLDTRPVADPRDESIA